MKDDLITAACCGLAVTMMTVAALAYAGFFRFFK